MHIVSIFILLVTLPFQFFSDAELQNTQITLSSPSTTKTWEQGPLSLTWINFNRSIPASNYIHYKVSDEFAYPFPNLHRWTLGMDK